MSFLSTEAERAAHSAFQEADDRWSAELQKCFGKRAGDQRYQQAGKGEIGSPLRQAYEAREAARVAFDRSRGLDERGFRIDGH